MKTTIIAASFLLVFFRSSIFSQCTYVIPSGSNLILSDTTMDCSFAVSQKYYVCNGVTLTMRGNSTCFNKFFAEDGATITFNDTVGSSPYGSFSFYLQSGATLNFNNSVQTSFHFIDTLVYEPGAVMTDTGAVFHDSTVCTNLIFDYSQIGGFPCPTLTDSNYFVSFVGFWPNPFSSNVHFMNAYADGETGTLRIYDLQGKMIEEIHFIEASEIELKSEWKGACVLEFTIGDLQFRKLGIRE